MFIVLGLLGLVSNFQAGSIVGPAASGPVSSGPTSPYEEGAKQEVNIHIKIDMTIVLTLFLTVFES